MSDIKTTIIVLCKHLNSLFSVYIKPEMFRLAKYNKSEDKVVPMFWSLLRQILTLEKSACVVKSIKLHFLTNLKYECIQFYSLPEDMSYGSRELLIAFSYLLALDYLNKWVYNAIVMCPINPEVSSEDKATYGNLEHFSFDKFKSSNDYENAILWMEGRSKHNKNAYTEYKNQFKKLSLKIKSTDLPELDLSYLEILAISNRKYAKEYLEKTESLTKIVANHERWLAKQSLFWEWMNSVLLERRKDFRSINTEEIDKMFAKAIK